MFEDTKHELQQDLPLRWARIQSGLAALGADAMVLTTPVGLLYATGRVFTGCVWVPREGTPWCFVQRPAGLRGEHVVMVRKPEEIPEHLAAAGLRPGVWALEGDEIPWSLWTRLARISEAPPANGSGAMRVARSVKTPHEINLMRETCRRHAALVASFAALYSPGMTDQEWTTEMEHAIRKAGSLGLFRINGTSMEIFTGTVLAGDNAGAPSPYDFALGGAGVDPSLPIGQNGTRLAPGMTVMVDLAVNFFGYLSDCSRTFSIGQPSPETLRAHQLSIDIQTAVAAAAKPGASCEELYQLGLRMAEQGGLAGCFMGGVQKAKFIGHGLGLYINEWPVIGARSPSVLEAGNVIALEPKFVLPGTGAVGVEDTFLVTADGLELLTPCARPMPVLPCC